MSYVTTPYRGLGVSLAEMQRRRILSEWGGGWRSEESQWDNGGEELPDIVAAPLLPPTIAPTYSVAPTPGLLDPGVSSIDTETPSTASNVVPGSNDVATASSDPQAAAGPVVTIRVQLRNAGNFNPKEANTKLRFTGDGRQGW